MTDTVYIALGSNVGDRENFLAAARAALAEIRDSRVVAWSPIEETEPIGPIPQGKFLNQMLAVETSLEPEQMLSELLDIERKCGRTRDVRWGPRTLDLDIVQFGERHVTTDKLTIPHPELAKRDFWQREIAAIEHLFVR